MAIPKSWKATPQEIKNGWKHSPKLLLQLVDELNNEEFVEDENASMETMDNILTILESKYNITERGKK